MKTAQNLSYMVAVDKVITSDSEFSFTGKYKSSFILKPENCVICFTCTKRPGSISTPLRNWLLSTYSLQVG